MSENASGSARLRVIYPKLKQLKKLAKLWSISTARTIMEEMHEVIPLLKAKKQHSIRQGLRHCVATLSGVLEARADKELEVYEVKIYIKKLFPVIKTLREDIKELGILDTDTETPTPKKKSISIRPGIDEVSQEAQTRIQDSMTDEDGSVRKAKVLTSGEELSTLERIWEEAEYQRIIREQRINDWSNDFYGQIDTAFKKYGEQISALKMYIPQKAILQLGPVVPTARTDQIFKLSELKRAGVNVEFSSGYAIFENQLLLTVNTNQLADEDRETDGYRVQYRKYRKHINKFKDLFGPLNDLKVYAEELKDELAWYDEVPPGSLDVGADRDVAAEARTLRLKWATQELVKVEAQISTMTNNLMDKQREYDKLIEEFAEFTKKGRVEHRGKMGSYSTRCYEYAARCLEEINKRLTAEEHISFVTQQGFVHGQTSLFWVMKDTQIGRWSSEISLGSWKLIITDWCLPKKSRTSTIRALDREVYIHQGLITLVHKLVSKGYVRRVIDERITKYLEQVRQPYNDESMLIVDKIVAEAESVFKELIYEERLAKTIEGKEDEITKQQKVKPKIKPKLLKGIPIKVIPDLKSLKKK